MASRSLTLISHKNPCADRQSDNRDENPEPLLFHALMSPNDRYRSSEVIHGRRGRRSETPPQPTVNNFAAARVGGTRFGWTLGFHFLYPLPRFFRPGGPGLLTTSRLNDFEFYRPARRAGLTL